MTLSSTLEMKLRGRSGSKAPAQAICRTLGIETVSEEAEARLNNLVHWGYGASWGAVRGVLGAAGLRGLSATVAFFALVWTAEQILLSKTGVAPPLPEQAPEEIAIDAWHHFVYAQAASLAYAALSAGERS
jgi:hypothetical protein